MKLILYYLIFCVSIISCKKDDDVSSMEQQEQPPITAENTFSCKINGELFIPKDFSSFPNSFDGYNVGFPLDSNNWFSRFSNEDMNMYIYIHNISGIGTYEIKQADGNNDFFDDVNTVVEFSENRSLASTHISTNLSGTIEVLEYEPLNKIIFKFDEIILQSIDNPNDIITLTEGKANFNLSTFN
jgi:hypothetical protein